MKRTARKSDDRMETFARQYVMLQFNGKHAAIAAGYSKKTAESTASRLLRNDKVKRLLAKFAAPIEKKMDYSVQRVLMQIARHAFVDPRELFNPDNSLKNISQLSEDTAACIHAIEHTGKRTDKIRLTNQLHALELLARYHKLFSEDRTPMDLGVKVIVLDMPRPLRQVGSGAAALPPPNGHNGNGNGSNGNHD
jgi:phage terminase small subunit